MILKDVMQAIADRLDTIPNLRVSAYPADSVTPPAAVVGYPEEYEFDSTYARGMDRISNLPVVLLISRVYDRVGRDEISNYVSGSGAASVKTVLESGTYTAFDVVRVSRVEFDIVRIASTDYLAATFALDIAGQGD